MLETIIKEIFAKCHLTKDKIVQAIVKAFKASGSTKREETAQELTRQVIASLKEEGCDRPTVEHIQDIVERVLMDNGFVQTAKSLYPLPCGTEPCSRDEYQFDEGISGYYL